MAGALGSESRTLHAKLYITMGEYLPRNTPEFNKFHSLMNSVLPPGDTYNKGKKKEVPDLLNCWETRGGIGIGNYTELLRVLREAELGRIVDIVQPIIESINTQLDIEKRARYNVGAPDPPMDEDDFPDGDPGRDYYT